MMDTLLLIGGVFFLAVACVILAYAVSLAAPKKKDD